jgi:hypothetical protein
MYGLYYTAAQHFLRSGYRLIDNGTRPLIHETNICDFLESINWRRAYCRLGLYLTPWFRAGLAGAGLTERAWRRFLRPAQVSTLRGLLEAQAIARATRK